MLQVLTNGLLLILVFFVGACVGLRFLRWTGSSDRDRLEMYVLASAFGLALITEGLVLLGMLGFLTPWWIGLFLVIMVAAGAREARFFLGDLLFAARQGSPSLSGLFLGAGFILFSGINFLKALLPPHGPTDVLYYHLTLPKLYLAHGAIVTLPTFFPSFFPSNGEALFALSLFLGGPVFVSLTHFGFALLTVLALYGFTKKYFGKGFALLPGIIYLTCPVVNSWGTMAYSDNILGFYLFVLVLLLLEFDGKMDWKVIPRWGVLTGMILGLKYQALPLLGVICLCFFILNRRQLKQFGGLLTISLALGAIIASAWYIRNYVVSQNPFFPILNDIFPSPLFRSGTTWWIDSSGKGAIMSMIDQLKQNSLGPLAYLFTAAGRNDGDFQRFLGPLFLGLAPLVLFLRRNTAKWPVLFLIVALSLLSVSVLRGNLRYVIILIILWSFLCGAVAQELFRITSGPERFGLMLFFLGVIGVYSVQNYQLLLSHHRWRAAVDPQLASSFLRAFEPSYRAAEFANHHLPPGAKPLFHGLVRYFYFNFEPWNDYRDQSRIDYDQAQSAEDVLRVWREQGITHIIAQDHIPPDDWSNVVLYDRDPRFRELTGRYLTRLFSGHDISIYRIRYPGVGVRTSVQPHGPT